MKKQKKQVRKRGYLRVIIPVIIIGLIAWGVFAILSELSKNAANTSSKNNQDTPEVITPEEDPTKSTDDATGDNKATPGGSDTSPAPTTDPDTGLQQANVRITYAGTNNNQVSANGEVSNVIETEGTCLYTFTHAATGKTITLASTPLPSSRSTPCAEVSNPQSDFPSGKWSVVLTYTSNKSKGVSQSYDFQIP